MIKQLILIDVNKNKLADLDKGAQEKSDLPGHMDARIDFFPCVQEIIILSCQLAAKLSYCSLSDSCVQQLTGLSARCTQV